MPKRISAVQSNATPSASSSAGPASLREGIYQFNYWLHGSPDDTKGRGLAVLRAGSVLGSDEWGGVFSGSYRARAQGSTHHVKVSLQVPPFGELVTGLCAGASGMKLDIEGSFEAPEPKAIAIVPIEGVPVALELVYIGAVPTT